MNKDRLADLFFCWSTC